ncbi:MAG TPA: hypothetical protein VMV23_03420 [Candidatus Nanopelagicaceae bacterium]|nr:hypothetical protein [Candidatus Nanopelagicaceae bacterium]
MIPTVCTSCQTPGAAVSLDGQVLCDRCADRRLASITGWPELPPPPPPEIIAGPDGRHHTILYRIMRWPGGITARSEELGLGLDEGYRLDLSIDHEDDPGPLLARLRAAVRGMIAHPYLEPQEWHGWVLRAEKAGGRLTEDDESDLPRVVIDGHSLAWEDYGRLLTAYVGWSFHLRLGVEPWAGEGEVGLASALPASEDDLARTTGDVTAFVIDSSHYPSPDQWRRRDRRGDG